MITAVIFDLDGTITDNEGDWEEVFRRVWEEYSGARWIEKKWLHVVGMGMVPNWRRLVKDEVIVQKLAARTFELYKEKVADRGEVRVREGMVEAVEKARELGWLTALCTGSSWNTVEEELEQLGLYLAFDITTTGEEVLAQKPDPEIYILTAQKLGVDFRECLVVEDSVSGVEAGAAAGMEVAGLVTEYSTATVLRAAGAKYSLKDMKELAGLMVEIKSKEQVIDSGEEV